MKMKTYIEMAEKKAGKQAELAKYLNVRYTTIGLVKSGKRGLPEALCIKLADFIEVNPLAVIAASNLITEKDEERRKIFENCLSKVASLTSITLLIGVISIMTPPTANASQSTVSAHSNSTYFVFG